MHPLAHQGPLLLSSIWSVLRFTSPFGCRLPRLRQLFCCSENNAAVLVAGKSRESSELEITMGAIRMLAAKSGDLALKGNFRSTVLGWKSSDKLDSLKVE